VYEKEWTPITRLARGIILDHAEGRVIATPFPKFFNVGEQVDSIPDKPFETFEKVDGSLIILYHYQDEWRTATKGSFVSEQARWAGDKLYGHCLYHLDPAATYLLEAVYPENRIVVRYQEEKLVLLAAYDGRGRELDYARLQQVAHSAGWSIATRFYYSRLSDLLATARILTSQEEGFVVRFPDGLRLKIKGDEYRRIHALISRCTPLAVWEAMKAGDDLKLFRRDLAEEFWFDFDAIYDRLHRRLLLLLGMVHETGSKTDGMSDKELGLMLQGDKAHGIPLEVRSLLFPRRKVMGSMTAMLADPRTREAVYRTIRPTGNRLRRLRAKQRHQPGNGGSSMTEQEIRDTLAKAVNSWRVKARSGDYKEFDTSAHNAAVQAEVVLQESLVKLAAQALVDVHRIADAMETIASCVKQRVNGDSKGAFVTA
jgi:RNA ligase